MKAFRVLAVSFVFAALALISEQAMADGSFAKVAFSYSSETQTDNGVSVTTGRTMYDIGGYYKFQGGGWVLGALYQSDSKTTTASVNRTSYGLSGGWMTPKESGFYLLATYFISSKYGDFDGGSGYQLDFGYKTPTKMPLVLQMSYKAYDYSKYDHKDTMIDPYLGFMIMF